VPNPPKPDDIRLRRWLADAPDEAQDASRWPVGYTLSTLTEADANDVHALLVATFDDEERAFDAWWANRSGDDEYDPALVFLLRDSDGRLAAMAWCWSSGFLKDLAVGPFARRRGLAAALLAQVFRAFAARGAAYVDLKTNRINNAAAYALYINMGMVEVDWGG